MRTDLTQPSPTGTVDTIRVLHIDDEREPLQMTKKLLEMLDEGLKVESVSSPVEALEMLREGGFDCVARAQWSSCQRREDPDHPSGSVIVKYERIR